MSLPELCMQREKLTVMVGLGLRSTLWIRDSDGEVGLQVHSTDPRLSTFFVLPSQAGFHWFVRACCASPFHSRWIPHHCSVSLRRALGISPFRGELVVHLERTGLACMRH